MPLRHNLFYARHFKPAVLRAGRGAPMAGVSVFCAVDGWTVETILAELLSTRSTYATATLGVLRNSGLPCFPRTTAHTSTSCCRTPANWLPSTPVCRCSDRRLLQAPRDSRGIFEGGSGAAALRCEVSSEWTSERTLQWTFQGVD